VRLAFGRWAKRGSSLETQIGFTGQQLGLRRVRVASLLAICVAGSLSCASDRGSFEPDAQVAEQSEALANAPLCYGAPGLQPQAPSPMVGLCPAHRNQSPAVAAQSSTRPGGWATGVALGAVVRGAPAISSSGKIVTGSTARIVTLNPNGGVFWGPLTPGLALGSSPAIGADGHIYMVTNEGSPKVRQLNAADGSSPWSAPINGTSSAGPALSADGATLYVTTQPGRLYALNTSTGATRWSKNTGAIWTSPAVAADGTIYVGADDGLYAFRSDGTKAWGPISFGTGALVRASPAIATDGTIYVGTDLATLEAVNPDGTKLGTFTASGMGIVRSSPAIASDGTIYFGTRDHKLYALNPNRTLKWTFLTGGNVDSSPAIGADGTVYVGSDDFKLYAIRPNGTQLFNFATGNFVRGAVAIGRNGTVYVGSDDQKLWAFGPGTCGSTDTTCNAIDENCSGNVDEGYASQATTCGTGACARTGVTSCVNGAAQDSCTPGTPGSSDTTCDNIDDNCNGTKDEGYAGSATTCGVGACASTGATSCVNGAVQNSCVAGTPAASDTTCNAIDDNCNGIADEGFTSSSTTCGAGACASTGTTSCVAGALQNSCSASNPQTSFDADCDGVDDDCNGVIDDACGVNLAVNGTFETGVATSAGWRPTLPGEPGYPDAVIEEPQYAIWERSDTNGTAGAVRVNVTATPGLNFHNAGFFFSLKVAVPKGSFLHVTLRAKSLSGGNKLNMMKTWGGSEAAQVTMTNQWATYEMVVLTTDDTSGLVFNVVNQGPEHQEMQPVATGSFLLDDIDVRLVSCTSSAGCGNTNPIDIFGGKLAELWDMRARADADAASLKLRSVKGLLHESLIVTTPAPNDAYYGSFSVLDNKAAIDALANANRYATGSVAPDLIPAGSHPYVAVVQNTWFTYTDGTRTPRMFELRARTDGAGPMLSTWLGPNSAGTNGTTATYTPDASGSSASTPLPQIRIPRTR
jgi:outer membrane protein assembly factor BamB